jgi:hypothetical protein
MASPKLMLMLVSLWVIMFSGVRWQVLRKKRTSLADVVHLEDSEFGNSTRYRVIAGAETTGGEYFVVEALVRPDAYGVWRGAGPGGGAGLSSSSNAAPRPGSEPPHSHGFQTEVVIVKSGMLGFWKGPRAAEVLNDEESSGAAGGTAAAKHRPAAAPGRGRTGIVGPGDAIVFAAGEPHAWWNAGVSDPDAQLKKEKEKEKEEYKKNTNKKKKNKNDKDDTPPPPPLPPVATTAEPGQLLVQVVTWPAGPAGERLYENLAGLGHDYGSPLAVGPGQRALTYSRAAARLETMTADGWSSLETWALPALEMLGYKGTYAKYRSDLARAVDLDVAAQAYGEARAAEEGGGAGGGAAVENKQVVKGKGLSAELIAATMKGKEERRAKLGEIARRRRAEQEAAAAGGGGGGSSEEGAAGELLPPPRKQWHAGGQHGEGAAAGGGDADGEERRRDRAEEDEEDEEGEGKDEL